LPPKGVAQQLSTTIPEGGAWLHRCDLTHVITDEIADVITLPFSFGAWPFVFADNGCFTTLFCHLSAHSTLHRSAAGTGS